MRALTTTPPIRALVGVRIGNIDKENANDRGDNCRSPEQKRKDHRRAQTGGKRPHEHGANERNRVGFEDVRRHSSAIAHVVADVVGDGRRIARIVLLEIRFHLANEVRPNVGRLRVNSATQTREDRNQRSAQSDPDEAGDRLVTIYPGHQQPKNTDRKQRQSDHEKPGNCSAIKGGLKSLFAIQSGPLSRANIGDDSDPHSDVTSAKRADCAQDKPCGRGKVTEHPTAGRKSRRLSRQWSRFGD